MKTETQIAEENINDYKKETGFFACDRKLDYLKAYIDNHKATCQRWLEFLIKRKSILWFDEKIKDLKQAITKYEDTGI